MAIFETYSKRNNPVMDINSYDFNEKIKNQIFFIVKDFIKKNDFSDSQRIEFAEQIIWTICKEEGLKKIVSVRCDRYEDEIELYIDCERNTEKVLNAYEIIFHFVDLSQKYYSDQSYKQFIYSYSDAVADFNIRMKENGVGYELREGKIIRVDNQLLHKETILPTLALLHNHLFKNAEEEFLKAHEHFRHRRNKECLNECLKSFESVMKIVCDQNGWEFGKTDQAKSLINTLIKHNFFPAYHESQLNAIRQLLEGSVPTLRNKNSSHGQGAEKIVVPDHLASYVLYITGATIKLIAETQECRKII